MSKNDKSLTKNEPESVRSTVQSSTKLSKSTYIHSDTSRSAINAAIPIPTAKRGPGRPPTNTSEEALIASIERKSDKEEKRKELEEKLRAVRKAAKEAAAEAEKEELKKQEREKRIQYLQSIQVPLSSSTSPPTASNVQVQGGYVPSNFDPQIDEDNPYQRWGPG